MVTEKRPDFVQSGAEVRLRARQGLAIYFGMVVLLSAVFQVLLIETRSWLWVIPLMWSPAAASVVARLALGEGFADVSFRVGGRRGWQAIAMAVVFPIVIGLPVYGSAWMTGLARFAPRPGAVAAQFASASPVAAFGVMLAVAATIGTIMGILTAAGEEIGWRGYMLTRLIDAGVPCPILLSGLIWGLWHVPIVLGAGYAAGPLSSRLGPAAGGLGCRLRCRVRPVTLADRQCLAGDRAAWRVEQHYSVRLRCGQDRRRPFPAARRGLVVGRRVGCPDGDRDDHCCGHLLARALGKSSTTRRRTWHWRAKHGRSASISRTDRLRSWSRVDSVAAHAMACSMSQCLFDTGQNY